MSVLTLSPRHVPLPRRRTRGLSLLATRPPPLLNLPSELVLFILELSLLQSNPGTLLSLSKTISSLVESILYRIVVLDSRHTITLFHRTSRAKSHTFFSAHVRKLVVTWSPIPHSETCRQIWGIIAACTGLRSLVLPPGYHPATIASLLQADGRDSLCELTLATYDEVDHLGRCSALHYLPNAPNLFYNNASSLTHLRICEPSAQWHSPSSILDSLGPLPCLTHIQLTRTCNANEENDLIFMEDIQDLLARDNLQMIVVSVFPSVWGDIEGIFGSAIWELLHDHASKDPRLLPAIGQYDVWKNEVWSRTILSGPLSFWATI